MRSGVQQHDAVHLEAQVDGIAGAAVAGDQSHATGLLDHDLAEEIDAGGEVAFGQAVLASSTSMASRPLT